MTEGSFIIDCSYCKAKVAAKSAGVAEAKGRDYDTNEPYGERLLVGQCPVCGTLLAGKCHQTAFEDWGEEFDRWSEVVRVYPDPGKTFSSHRIPRVVTDSLTEADRALQGGAHTAACVMFGRALEALCRDVLDPPQTVGRKGEVASKVPAKKKQIMLAKGISELRERNLIDERLYDWSQQLHAFRNIAAHPDEISISVRDAEDLQTFVYAIVEYIYDLADRYDDFKLRIERRKKRKMRERE